MDNNTVSIIVKECILEYLNSDMAALRRYAMDDDRSGYYYLLADRYWHKFPDWYENEYPDESDETYQKVRDYEFADEALDELVEEFGEWIESSGNVGNDLEGYTKELMNYEGIVKNQWLIHFTDNAASIAKNGFTIGMDDMERLALTTYYQNDSYDKKYGGYNFAYRLQDFEKFGKGDRRGTWKYGDEAVLFRASGILFYHGGDNEYQVVFRGDTAKDIIPMYEVEGEWSVQIPNRGLNKDIIRPTLPDLVDWIVHNYDQYRKPIRKSNRRKK